MLNFKKLTGILLLTCLSATSVHAEIDSSFVAIVSKIMTDSIIEGAQSGRKEKLNPTQIACLQNTASSKMTIGIQLMLSDMLSPSEIQQLNNFFSTPTGIKFNKVMLNAIQTNREISTKDFTKQEEKELELFSKTRAYKKLFNKTQIQNMMKSKSTEERLKPVVFEKILSCNIV